MIKSKWIGFITVIFMLGCTLLVCLAYFNPSAFSTGSGQSEPDYVSAIDKGKVMSIEIIADENEWAAMLKNAAQEEYIPATIIIDGQPIENVGIRPKGNSSLSTVAQDSTTDRYSFKIEFDHYINGQTWKGLDKLVINNMQGDSTYMKEYLSYDIMEYIGVASPLYAFADISVNGVSWGFYLAVETLEESFAGRVYGSDYGKLYKPESMGARGAGRMNEFIGNMQNEPDGAGVNPERFMAQANIPQEGDFPQQGDFSQRGGMPQQGEIDQGDQARVGFGGIGGIGGMGGMGDSNGVSLEYTGDSVSSYSAIFENSVFQSNENDNIRVIKALEKLSKGEDLENAVDVEACLRYFAAHTVVVSLDSYVSNMGHNYYLYEKNGQLTILPWDYNLSFGGFQSGSATSVVNFPIDTPVSGVSLEDRPLLGKLLEVPEYLDLYHGYLREIVNGYFNSGMFEKTVDSLEVLISPYVESDPSAFYDFKSFTSAVDTIKKLGLLRAKSVEGQLDGIIPSTSAEQTANPEKLLDSGEIDLMALGSQGGGVFRTERGSMQFDENAWPQEAINRDANTPQFQDRVPTFQQPGEMYSGYSLFTWMILGGFFLILIAATALVLNFNRRKF